MKVLFVLLSFLLLEVCRGMGDGEYCFSCDAGTSDGSENHCNDKYIPPPSIHISPNICDDIGKNVTEENRLCKRYPKGYIFRCYTDYDGNFFNCKSSCTVPLEDVGKSIGIQDNLSKVMNHGLLAGFGSDNEQHPDLLSNLGLDMFNNGANNVHAPAVGKGSHPNNQVGKPATRPGYPPVSQPGAPRGAFNVDKPLMFQNDFPQYNFQEYGGGQQYPNVGQTYGNPNQFGNNRGYANPYGPSNQGQQGQQGQYPQYQGNGYQQNPVYSPHTQGQYPIPPSPQVPNNGQHQGAPLQQHSQQSHATQGSNIKASPQLPPPPPPSLANDPSNQARAPNSYNYVAPPASSNHGSFVPATQPSDSHQNHVISQPSYPPPPPSNVYSNQGRAPNSYNYVAPPAPSNHGSFVPPTQPSDSHQNHVIAQPSYPPPPPSNVYSNQGRAPNSYNYVAPPASSNHGSFVPPPPSDSHQNHVIAQPSYPPPPMSNVYSNQGRAPNSYNYVAPPAPSNHGSFVPQTQPSDSHQNHVIAQPPYPHPSPPSQTNVYGNLDPVPSSYVPATPHSQYQFPSGNQGHIQGGNQYNVNNNERFNDAQGSSGSNFGGTHGSRDSMFNEGMHGTLSKSNSGLNDQTAFNKAASRFGHNNFGTNGAEFGKQNGGFHGFNNFGVGQHDNQGLGNTQSSDYGQDGKVFDLLNSNMAKQKSLLNQKHSSGNSQSGLANTGKHSSNSNGNTYSSSSKSTSGKTGGGSFGVFSSTGLAGGKAGTQRGVGSRGVNTNLYGNQGMNKIFDNFGTFFRQPARKSGATQKKDNRVNFNFGNLDDFMNEEFRHHQGELQPVFNRHTFANQGYQKLFPDHRSPQAFANGGQGKTSKLHSIPNSVGQPHTEYGRFFDFIGR